MNSRKLKILGLVLTGTIIGFSFVGCGSKESKNIKEEKVENFEETGYIAINGNKYAIPLSIEDMKSEGYTLDIDSLGIGDGDNKLVSGVYYNEYIPVLKDGVAFGSNVKVINTSEETKAMEDSDIYCLRFSDDANFSLKDGITVGSSEEDFTSTFGEPLVRNESGDIATLTYADDDNGFVKVEFASGTSIAVEYVLEDAEASALMNENSN